MLEQLEEPVFPEDKIRGMSFPLAQAEMPGFGLPEKSGPSEKQIEFIKNMLAVAKSADERAGKRPNCSINRTGVIAATFDLKGIDAQVRSWIGGYLAANYDQMPEGSHDEYTDPDVADYFPLYDISMTKNERLLAKLESAVASHQESSPTGPLTHADAVFRADEEREDAREAERLGNSGNPKPEE